MFDKTGLFLAVEKENIEIIKLLLNRDDINIDELNSILEINYEKFLEIYKEGNKVDNNDIFFCFNFYNMQIVVNISVLQYAIKIGNLEILKLFYSKKGSEYDLEYQILNLFFFINKICESPYTCLRRAIVLRKKKEYEKSLQLFEDILKQKNIPIELTEDDIIFQIAFTYQLMNQFEKAQKLHDDLHVRHPNIQIIFIQYCSLLFLKNDKHLLSLLKIFIRMH